MVKNLLFFDLRCMFVVLNYYLTHYLIIKNLVEMKTFTTPQGCTVNFDKKATAAHLTQILDNGQGKKRYYVDLTGNYSTYSEFGEEYTEFEAIDWDGSKIGISEIDIIQ